MKRAALALLLSSLFASCFWYGGNGMRALETNRETWENHGIENYQFTFDIRCYCNSGLLPARIIVRADTLHAILNPETGDTLRARSSDRLFWKEHPNRYPTIDRLFEIADRELSKFFYQRPDSIRVEYNETYGHPEYIYIDPRSNMSDDESIATVDDLVVHR